MNGGIQPRFENPFSRVVSAVERNTRHAVQTIRQTGIDLAARMRHAHTDDIPRLEQARNTITRAITRDNIHTVAHTTSEASKQVAHYAWDHKKEIAKNIAPSLAISIVAKVAGGALAVPVIAAASAAGGLNNLRKNVGMTNGRDVFETSAILRSGYDQNVARAIDARSPEPNTEGRPQVTVVAETSMPESTSGRSSYIQRVANSRVGRGMRAYLNLERTATSHVVTHNANINRVIALAQGRTLDNVNDIVSDLRNEHVGVWKLHQLKSDAVIARMSANSPEDRAAARAVHLATSKRLKEIEASKGANSAIPFLSRLSHRAAQKAYPHLRNTSFKILASEALATSAAVRTVKSGINSVAIYLGLSAVGVHAGNPFRNLADGMWGDIAHHIGSATKEVGAHAEQAITKVLEAAPHGVAYAEEAEGTDIPAVVHATKQTVHTAVTDSAEQRVVRAHRVLRGTEDIPARVSPATSNDTHSQSTIDTRNPITGNAPIGPEPHDVPQTGQNPDVGEHVLSEKPNIIIPPTEYTLSGSNLTASLFNDHIVGVGFTGSAVEYYGSPGSGAEVVGVMSRIPGLFDDQARATLEAEIRTNEAMSFGALYRKHVNLFVEANKLKQGAKVLFENGSAQQSTAIVAEAVAPTHTIVTIDTNTSLTTFLARSGLLGEVGEPKDIFARAGSGKIFFERVMEPNSGIISDTTSFNAIRTELSTNPDVNLGYLYRKFPGAFKELDTMTNGSSFNLAQEASAHVKDTLETSEPAVQVVHSDTPATIVEEVKPDPGVTAVVSPEDITPPVALSSVQEAMEAGTGNSFQLPIIDPLTHQYVGVVSSEDLTYTPVGSVITKYVEGTGTTIQCFAKEDDTLCFAHSGVFPGTADAGVPIEDADGNIVKYVEPGSGESLRASMQHWPQESVTTTDVPLSPTPVPTPQTLQDWPRVQEVTMKGPAQIQYALDHNDVSTTLTVNGEATSVAGDGGMFFETRPKFSNMEEYVQAMGPDFQEKLASGAYTTIQTCSHYYWEGFKLAMNELALDVSSLNPDEKWALRALQTGKANQDEIIRATAIVRNFFTRTGNQEMLEQFNNYLKPARTAVAQQTGTIVAFYKEQ